MTEGMDNIRRGVILWLLHSLGGEANFLVLMTGLRRWGCAVAKAKLLVLVAELEAKGYLSTITERLPGLTTEMHKCRLTPKADDFLRGEIEDADIERIGD